MALGVELIGMVSQTNFNWENLGTYYRFQDSIVGSTLFDSKGSANGTLSNTGIWTTSGKTGNGGLFDSTADYIAISSTSTIRFSGSFSISTWIYPRGTAPASGGLILEKTNDGVSTNYIIKSNSSKNISFIITLDGSDVTLTTTFNGLELNAWYHILCVYNSSSGMKIYINGVERATNSTTGAVSNDTAGLGINTNAANSNFLGVIDEIGFFNAALKATNALEIYNNGTGKFY